LKAETLNEKLIKTNFIIARNHTAGEAHTQVDCAIFLSSRVSFSPSHVSSREPDVQFECSCSQVDYIFSVSIEAALGKWVVAHFSFAFNFFCLAFCVTVLLTAKKSAGMLCQQKCLLALLFDLSSQSFKKEKIVNSGKLGHARLIVCIPFVEASQGNYRLIKRTIDVVHNGAEHAAALLLLGTVRDSANILYFYSAH
jgi:hypothetical protein